jgi:hypothetical protein
MKAKIDEKIWNIQEYIQKLETIKNLIIVHLDSLEKLDGSTKEFWISHVKEFYYYIVSAWETLQVNVSSEEINLDKSKGFLYGAQNRLSQVISELNIFQSDTTSNLITQAETVFKECWDAFWVIFNKLLPKEDLVKPNEIVIKISDLEYHLPCSVCGDIAVEFKIGESRFSKIESLLFKGITHGTALKITLAENLFKLLQKKDLRGVHNFMKKHHAYEGLDAYCPECDKIYCWEHYNAKEEYDDSFYDCTRGICPKGHKRMIDD